MSDLTLKQVCPKTGSSVCSVPNNGRVAHNNITNTVDVLINGEKVNSYDLTQGVVYLMNAAGKTIDKYESNGVTPLQQAYRGNLDSQVFSLSGVRYITLDKTTYLIDNRIGRINVHGFNSEGTSLSAISINKWQILQTVQKTIDFFGTTVKQDIEYFKVLDASALTEMPFQLIEHEGTFAGKAVPEHEQLRIFGVNFRLPRGVAVIYNGNKYITNGSDGLICQVAVENE